MHRQGAQAWGGDGEFKHLMRFLHPQVQLIDFSPGDRYLVTYSTHEPSNPTDTHRRIVLKIFDVRTGKVMWGSKGSIGVSFHSLSSAYNISRVSKLTTLEGRQADAMFWSPAGKFIALQCR